MLFVPSFFIFLDGDGWLSCQVLKICYLLVLIMLDLTLTVIISLPAGE